MTFQGECDEKSRADGENLDIKREKGWSWKHICENRRHSPVLIVGALPGPDEADQAVGGEGAALFGSRKAETTLLNEVPMRGTATDAPDGSAVYRFYEIVMVNGPAWKALIEEEFGDGIMSAIDFDMPDRTQPTQGRPREDHHVRQVPSV